MNEELTKKLCNDFPAIYLSRKDHSNQPIDHFGFECGDGWFALLYELSTGIQKLIDEKKIKHFQVDQVKEKYACYDEQTEVLTKDGWKYFKNLFPEDLILTLGKKDKLEYHKPTSLAGYPYKGKMYQLKTRGVDLLVTPNHSLYFSKGTYYDGRTKPPKKIDKPFVLATPDVCFGKNKRFQKGGKWKGESPKLFTIPTFTYTSLYRRCDSSKNISRTYVKSIEPLEMRLWLRFLGWYIAEGCTSKQSQISVACNNVDGGKEKTTISKVVEDLKWKYALVQEDKSACLFNIYSKQLGLWLEANCRHGAAHKRVPSFVKELSPELIKELLDCLYAGDGHQATTSHILYTVSKKLADDVQELILKVGDVAHIKSHKPGKGGSVGDHKITSKLPYYGVNWLKKSYYHNTGNKVSYRKTSENWVDYEGMVYCATVPNHIMYVRRFGTPVWCGNSLRYYTSCEYPDDLDEDTIEKTAKTIHQLIEIAEKQSSVACETCGRPGKVRRLVGWYSMACDDHWKEKETK